MYIFLDFPLKVNMQHTKHLLLAQYLKGTYGLLPPTNTHKYSEYAGRVPLFLSVLFK